jgi:hypothetical protein
MRGKCWNADCWYWVFDSIVNPASSSQCKQEGTQEHLPCQSYAAQLMRLQQTPLYVSYPIRFALHYCTLYSLFIFDSLSLSLSSLLSLCVCLSFVVPRIESNRIAVKG